MSFISPTYALFLLSVILLYWLVQSIWLRLWVLLAASIVFYTTQQPYYVPLLVASTWINYQLGRAIALPADWRDDNWPVAERGWQRRRWFLLWLGIGLNLLLLLGFKYVPFLATVLADLLGWEALPQQVTRLNILVPLGISFFSFECIAYLIDVYRGSPASQEFLRFSAYKLFFPKLINGPITRYAPLISQMQGQQLAMGDRLAEGLWLLAWGATKKGLLADNLATPVNLIFENAIRAGSGDLWLATIAYGFQIYLDFSGYVDMARGSALLLGFELPLNFDFPYFSTSIADFWRRWHITLGDWLRNYLYFPLGGSRQGLARTCLNLLIVMAIAGAWHGAAWGFIVWGLLHGLGLAVHRLTDALSQRLVWLRAFWQSPPGVILAWVLTQVVVFSTWVFFRLPNLNDSLLVVRRLGGQTADAQFGQKVYVESLGFSPFQLGVLLWALAVWMGATYTFERVLKLQLRWYVKLLLVPVCLYGVWILAPEGALPYIYFDF